MKINFRRWIFTLVGSVMVFLPFVVAAKAAALPAQALLIDTLAQPYNLAPHLEYMEDEHHAFTLEDIRAGKYDHLWKKNSADVLFGSHVKSRYWFRVSFRFAQAVDDNAYVLVDSMSGLLTELDIVLAQEGAAEQRLQFGRTVPYNKRQLAGFLEAIKIQANVNTRIDIIGQASNHLTGIPVTIPLAIVSEASFQQKQQTRLTILLVFYSAMGALLIYNLCLFIILREKVYGLYIAFLASAILSCAGMDGMMAYWLFPDEPMLEFKVANFNGFVSASLYLAFIYTALNAKEQWLGWIKICYQLLMPLGLVFGLLSILVLSTTQTAILTQVYSSIVLPLTLVAIVLAIINKNPVARFLLVAEIFVVTGSLSFLLRAHNIIDFNSIAFWGMHWGFWFETLLLSLAVAARTNIIIQEKFKAQQQAYANEQQTYAAMELAYKNEREASAAMEMAVKTKNEFLATISHELRTPLNSIIGFSHLLLDNKYTQGAQRDYADTILSNGKQLLAVINDVLHLSLIDSNRLFISESAIDLRQLLQGLEVKYRLNAYNKHLDFAVNIASDIPQQVIVDEENLTQVLRQLLDNAFKFTHEGCVILSLTATKDALIFRVIDSGIGIAKEKLDVVFEPFIQGDSTNSRRYAGTGVGLYIAKSVSEKMGGTLTVKSKRGEGTEFTLSIPLLKIDTDVARPLLQENSGGMEKVSDSHKGMGKVFGRVLYAEDNVDNQQLVKLIVSAAGAHVTLAFDGQEAVDIVKQSPQGFDLILMDIQMPIMDGYAATKILKEAGCTIPIIAFSASSHNEIKTNNEVVFDGYLAKPIDKNKLLALLSMYLRKL